MTLIKQPITAICDTIILSNSNAEKKIQIPTLDKLYSLLYYSKNKSGELKTQVRSIRCLSSSTRQPIKTLCSCDCFCVWIQFANKKFLTHYDMLLLLLNGFTPKLEQFCHRSYSAAWLGTLSEAKISKTYKSYPRGPIKIRVDHTSNLSRQLKYSGGVCVCVCVGGGGHL